jgi:23S rRNA (uracil1939-C5)-methyltransferase
MGRKKRKNLLFESVKIEDIGAEGKSIAHVNDKVLFVPYTVPGDIVDVTVMRSRKKWMEGVVSRYHVKSDKRVAPVCSHFGVCGGCKWQHLPYKEQLFFKQKQVKDQLTRIGKLELPEIDPIIGAEKKLHYRNKLEFTFSPRKWLTRKEIDEGNEIEDRRGLGFHISGHFDKVLDIDTCYLQEEPSNRIRNFVKEKAIALGLSFHDVRLHEGIMRNLVIRSSGTGEWMVIVFFYEESPLIPELMQAIYEEFPALTALLYGINPKMNDSYHDIPVQVFHGRAYIVEKMDDLSFQIGAKSFYQTNSEQALRLYQVVRDFARLSGKECVYDLYTGTGTIALFLSRYVRKVTGIEYVEEAVDDARKNAQLNEINNAVFFSGDMKEVLCDQFIAQHGHPDVLITDPPRVGMHEDVVRMIQRIAPSRIVYVSCNPATQARDLQMLDALYKVEKVQPVDMFPHTHHVENVVLLEKRK